MYMLNFTPIFNTTSDIVHANVSYIMANQPPQMTTPMFEAMFILLGVGFLMLSAILSSDVGNDLSGILASIFLFISTIQAFAVDTVTGTGVTSMCTATTSGICTQSQWVLLENHMIYHYDLMGIVLGILFLVSLANLYRLWTDYKRITGQRNIGATSGINAPSRREQENDNVPDDPNSDLKQDYRKNY
jgi:hypothetical protein